MAQIFHPRTNPLSKASIFGAVFAAAALANIALAFYRSAYVTEAGVVREQPVPFSHDHHVRGLGIDCRYCHASVEDAPFAGMPAAGVCMNCHSQVWADSPMLEPVRRSHRTGEPIPWVRVHDLPDYVYFDHSIHVRKGVGCAECHGRVDRMPLMWREASLQMEWCVNCHRRPEKSIRPPEAVFLMGWQGPPASHARFDARALTDCSVCHR